MDERYKAIIESMANNDMNTASVSRELYFHWNTTAYHLDKIREKTGLDPRCFYDLVKLVEMVNEEDER